MRCSHCNHLNRSAAKVCSQCGKSLTAPPFQALGVQLQNRYRLDRKLGQGGMGAVYLATDARINRQIVVKEMLAPSAPQDQQEAEKNFRLEAEVLAKLHHAHIPNITDYFSDGGKYYLVMEWVNGEDLEKRLEKRGAPLPERQVARYALHALDVLEYLAQQQPPVIHRDIKPANIIVDQTDNAYLVDFGIARAKAMQAGAAGRDTSLYGTKGYAPPEQYAGKTEPRSDVYALGATMHHLLTNRDPRDPNNAGFPNLTTLVPSLAPALARLVTQMLDPDVTRRPMAAQVRRHLDTIGSQAPLLFPSSDKAYSVHELCDLCVKYPAFAIQLLKDRHIEDWLTKCKRTDLAVPVKQLRIQVNRRQEKDMRRALERLLQILNPARAASPLPAPPPIAVPQPPPVLKVAPSAPSQTQSPTARPAPTPAPIATPVSTPAQPKPPSTRVPTSPSSSVSALPRTPPPITSPTPNQVPSDRVVGRSIRAGAVVLALLFFMCALGAGVNAGGAFVFSAGILGLGFLVAYIMSRLATS